MYLQIQCLDGDMNLNSAEYQRSQQEQKTAAEHQDSGIIETKVNKEHRGYTKNKTHNASALHMLDQDQSATKIGNLLGDRGVRVFLVTAV